ncbi:hypothetical protein WDU94_013743 [Cyamophila willieti]
MSIKLSDLFSIFPIQKIIVKYLTAEDLKKLSSLGGEYEDFYFEFNRELELDQYNDVIHSKFKRIEKLTLKQVNHEVVSKETLSVLLALNVPTIDKEKINLRECTRLQTLTCRKFLVSIDSEDFPISLKKIILLSPMDIVPRTHRTINFNFSHLISLKEIDCNESSITDEAINNFPESLEKISLYCCKNISSFNIHHLVNLKEIDCNASSITNVAINNFPESLEKISLCCCTTISSFNIHHLVNLKEIDCYRSSITDEAINNFPESLEKISLCCCSSISSFNIHHLVNLKELDCNTSSITDVAINNFPESLEKISFYCCTTISSFNIHHLVNLKEINCSRSSITDVAINNFPESLEKISLCCCYNISSFNIDHLVNVKKI